ncbi:hypothetical protein E2C01_053315 [Portunus trituberculatus]|uniref:Uncharacterized protein n=1 Tax=Portunus trituberculatus TaxID=210409 RepID=A0A5B7GNW0_PORTR|nr:hypothetical protein [Portunus trituberculatus]
MGVPVWSREPASNLWPDSISTHHCSLRLTVLESLPFLERFWTCQYLLSSHSTHTSPCAAINLGDSLIPDQCPLRPDTTTPSLAHHGKGHLDDRYQATRRNAKEINHLI